MPDHKLSLETDSSTLITEDDTPVDNLPSEKQQRLLTEALYSSWMPGRSFLAAANVGVFARATQPPVVPDVFLSLDVQVAQNWWEHNNRSYFVWEFGKPPEVVIELVSNLKGNELGSKLNDYAQMRVSYYVVFDAQQQLGGPLLQVFELRGTHLEPLAKPWLEQVGLGLSLWQGVFEERNDLWLRWCDREGMVLPTGKERAEQERQQRLRAEKQVQQERQQRLRAEEQVQQERQQRLRAEKQIEQEQQQRLRAEEQIEQEQQQRLRAEEQARQLAQRLRELGIELD
ncbi:Uma2 family endonuclease [Anthocerotibacter panamensis]|uniref:Uma2 family endonuclease n=1 Tax=Anthocerotibacter panamensis TaxID=2857077 RepID=UPI001C403DB1|nr:Uma2 family endonuclease [Anthocerotibacter panamensis]